MSFILNALRKSEAERNAVKTEVVPLMIPAAGDSPRRNKFVWIMPAFLLVNLMALGYMFDRLQLPVQTVDTSQPAILVPVSGAGNASPVKANVREAEIPVAAEPAERKSISDSLLAKQNIVQRLENKISTVSQVQLAKATVKPLTGDKTDSKDLLPKVPERSSERLNNQPVVLEPIAQKSPEFKLREPENIAPPVLVSHVPWLRELDGNFQSKLPAFTVNVLAFADSPGERFVIIDMVKYKIGQHIKGAIGLKDILSDSLVLNYDGRDFRVEGP